MNHENHHAKQKMPDPPKYICMLHLDKILEMTNLSRLSDEQIGGYLVPMVEEEIDWDGTLAPF